MGIAGWSLRVSLTIAWRKGRFGMSDSSTNLDTPTTESISRLAFCRTAGLFISSAKAHSIVTDVVSVPAMNRSYLF
ncbi:unnamed protein product [Spirodela intermedia]|uniref:Uncharacterized protein n=1 Tax=Spirodela intermedia TaxID=51605 RepID=A0A7I8JQ95_SPIIN|nr:unnamed protein product [Spirodela intermedia]CAA6672349.1 unnamed protein product [Spirodela intermedia]